MSWHRSALVEKAQLNFSRQKGDSKMQRIGKLAHALLVLSGLIFPGEYLRGITPALAATQESDAQNEKRLIDGAKK